MKALAATAAPGALAFIAVLAFGASPASAQNICLAGKTKCVEENMAGLLKCHDRAERRGKPVHLACLNKAKAKFDGGLRGFAGSCFGTLEIRFEGLCHTIGDLAAEESKVDAFVLDVVHELDPGYPTPIRNTCSAKKKRCVVNKTVRKLRCWEKCQKDPATHCGVDLTYCLLKAIDKFDGGTDPTKGCFAKLEAKGGCLTTGDAAALEAKVDAFVLDVRVELEPPATPTPTPTPTATPLPALCCAGTYGCGDIERRGDHAIVEVVVGEQRRRPLDELAGVGCDPKPHVDDPPLVHNVSLATRNGRSQRARLQVGRTRGKSGHVCGMAAATMIMRTARGTVTSPAAAATSTRLA